MQSVTPDRTRPGLGSSAFARRYLRNRVFFLFLRVLRCFSSPGSPPYVMDWRMDTRGFLVWVSPFRNLRINGYLLLPEAYRSLSRLSSALSAKASALCPFCLTFALLTPQRRHQRSLILVAFDNFNYRCLPILRLSSKCTSFRKKLLEACFHKGFLSHLYMRRSRDRMNRRFMRCTYDHYTNLHVCSFQKTAYM